MASDAAPIAVGHATVVLDVPDGTRLGGYADREGGAAGSLDPLEVGVVTIGAGTRRFVWAVADLPCVTADLTAATRAAVVDTVPSCSPETVWLSATHTHAGPDTGCHPGDGPTPAPWHTVIPTTVAAAVSDAVRAESPARLVVRHGELADVAGQRSGPRPRRSVPFSVIEVRDQERTRGLVVVLPVHPTVLDAGNRATSADLPGAVRRALGTSLGAAWCVVATGAAGDVSTRPHRRAQTPAELRRLGDLVASQVAELLHAPPDAVVGDGTVAAASSRVAVAPRTDTGPPEPLAELERRIGELPEGSPQRRTAYTRWQGALLADRARSVRDPRCATGVVSIGDLRLAALGGEPFLDLADGWRARAGRGAVLVGYTNGYLGYLPTRDAYASVEYEVLISPCGPGAAEAALAECGRLLESLQTKDVT
ncbi:MAG: hypothetical protein GEV10_08555 [Streptosporangiales bacterium]|nr:hypothetical protein [Streptosporangiales bacterium]